MHAAVGEFFAFTLSTTQCTGISWTESELRSKISSIAVVKKMKRFIKIIFGQHRGKDERIRGGGDRATSSDCSPYMTAFVHHDVGPSENPIELAGGSERTLRYPPLDVKSATKKFGGLGEYDDDVGVEVEVLRLVADWWFKKLAGRRCAGANKSAPFLCDEDGLFDDSDWHEMCESLGINSVKDLSKSIGFPVPIHLILAILYSIGPVLSGKESLHIWVEKLRAKSDVKELVLRLTTIVVLQVAVISEKTANDLEVIWHATGNHTSEGHEEK